MDRKEIFEKLKEILIESEELTPEEAGKASEESRLQEDLNLDSVSLLYTVISIEDAFGFKFQDVSLKNLETVGDVVSLIGKKLS